jgi:CBS domain-containing protein
MKMDRALAEIIGFLKDTQPFTRLSPEALAELAAKCTIGYRQAGTVISEQDGPVDAVYILINGALQIWDPDNEALYGFLDAGDVYGAQAILCNNCTAARSVRVIEDCFFYTIGVEDFKALAAERPFIHDFFTEAFRSGVVLETLNEVRRHRFSESAAMVGALDQQIRDVVSAAFVMVDAELSIAESAQQMCDKRCSAVLITDADGSIAGIVTDRDLRHHVVAGGVDRQAPIRSIMSSPVTTISADSRCSDGVMTMLASRIKHLPVMDGDRPIGILADRTLIQLVQGSTLALMAQVDRAETPEALAGIHNGTVRAVRQLMRAGYGAAYMNQALTQVNDHVLHRFCKLALGRLGRPPCDFAFVVMGSEGRGEQSFLTDQDNALILERDDAESQAYFGEFGQLVCDWLHAAGYQYCKGDVMARNPLWRMSLSGWTARFAEWIDQPDSMAVMCASIALDMRLGFGSAALVEQLREAVHSMQDRRVELFLYHLSTSMLDGEPPLGFFRNFVLVREGENKDQLDLKRTMNFITTFARLYAQEQGLRATSTTERLQLLRQQGVLTEAEEHEITVAYELLMQMRLQVQADAIGSGQAVSNFLNPYQLGRLEQNLLKEVFLLIRRLQDRVRRHFRRNEP